MDHELIVVVVDQRDDLEEVRGEGGTDVQHESVINVGHNDGVFDRMANASSVAPCL